MTKNSKLEFNIRPAVTADVGAVLEILNTIIEIGGTTAFQKVLSADEFEQYFLTADECIACFVASDSDGAALGFQSLRTKTGLGVGWVDIATFTQRNSSVKGVGRALFNATLAFARVQGITSINATIRADNSSGLGYYAKMGFVEYTVAANVPLSDGTPVDRISKVYRLS